MPTARDLIILVHLARKLLGAAALRRILDRLDDGATVDQLRQFPAFETASELLADAGNIPPMLVDGLLPDNSLFLLTGKPKAGKSFLALDIADSVCRGNAVLGALTVNRRGPVIYLAMEDGKTELARRLTRRSYTPGDDHDIYFCSDAFSLTDPVNLAHFRETAAQLKPSLIVIDTAAEALDIRDWINRSEILTKIAPLRRLAREQCTVLLVAHNRKAEGDMGDEIAGSNALAGAVDGWISAHKVERRPNGNRRLFLRIEGRGGVGSELIAEMDHETLSFSVIAQEEAEEGVPTARENAYTEKRKQRRMMAINTMREMGNSATIPALAAAMNIGYNSAWALVREMVARGEIVEVGEEQAAEGGGRPAPTYRLTPAQT